MARYVSRLIAVFVALEALEFGAVRNAELDLPGELFQLMDLPNQELARGTDLSTRNGFVL